MKEDTRMAKRRVPRKVRIRDEDLIADLRRVAAEVGSGSFGWQDYIKHGRFSMSAVYTRFGRWGEVLRIIGLPARRMRGSRIPDEDLIADLQRVAREQGRSFVTAVEYGRLGQYSAGSFRRRFGLWPDCLLKAGLSASPVVEHVSVEDCLSDVRRVAEVLKTDFVLQEQYRAHGRYSCRQIIKLCGSWHSILRRAGLRVAPGEYSKEDCLRNLDQVRICLGRLPMSYEMRRPLSNVCTVVYFRKFGSWRKALRAYKNWMKGREVDVHIARRKAKRAPTSRGTVQSAP